MKLAIVGSVAFADPGAWGKARALIGAWIDERRPAAVISGGAPGIDSIAERIARQWGYSPEHAEKRLIVHLPKHPRWEPDGYKDRNLLIAQDCTDLLCIRCHASRTYGSGWTADRAQEMGKPVHREVL